MKRWIHAATHPRSLENKIRGVVSWNNYFYGYVPTKTGEKYYRSKTVRFDDSFGGTEEISEEEYRKFAQKYADVMGD